MSSSIPSLFPQIGQQMKLVLGNINPIIFIVSYTLLAFAVYILAGYFTDKALRKATSKEKFAGIFVNNCFGVVVFFFLGVACGNLVDKFSPMFERYQYLVCFSMIFVCFLRILLSENGRKVILTISDEAAKKILAKTKRVFEVTIFAYLSYCLIIFSNSPRTNIYTFLIITGIAIYYAYETCLAKNVFNVVMVRTPIAKVGLACNTIKYMNKNWWKLFTFLVFVFYYIEIDRLDFMSFILNSAFAFFLVTAVQFSNIFVMRLGSKCTRQFKKKYEGNDKKNQPLCRYAYLTASLIAGFLYIFVAFILVKTLFVSDFDNLIWLDKVSLSMKIFMQVYAIFLAYTVLNTYFCYKIETLSINKISQSKRLKGILQLMSKCVGIAFVVVSSLMLLINYGVSVSAIVGFLLSLAAPIALASQDTVKSFINGIVMLVENDIAIGDEVTVCGIHGVIEEIGIRTMKVREISGVLHSVPYSQVGIVSNKSRSYNAHRMDFYFPVSVEINKVNSVLENTALKLQNDAEVKPKLLGDFAVLGLRSFDDKLNKFVVTVKIKPEVNSSIDAIFFKNLKEEIISAGIENPVYIGGAKDVNLQKMI